MINVLRIFKIYMKLSSNILKPIIIFKLKKFIYLIKKILFKYSEK